MRRSKSVMMASNEGSSKTWTVDETYRLIRAFRRHPALWKKENSEYKNKLFRAGILELLGAEFRTNAEAIKEKLRSLRTIYGQTLKKHLKTDGIPKWEFFGALCFLKEEMTGDATEMNADENSIGSMEDRNEGVPNQRETQEPSTSIKRMRARSPMSTHRNNYSSNPSTVEPKATNPLLLGLKSGRNRPFGDYVALSLDLMNNALTEEKVKLKIQLLLSEALNETATRALSQLPSTSQTPTYAQSPSVQAVFPTVEPHWRADDSSDSQHYEDEHVLSRVVHQTRSSSADSF